VDSGATGSSQVINLRIQGGSCCCGVGGGPGYGIDAPSTATMTIDDPDGGTPVVTLGATADTAVEDGPPGVFTVTRNGDDGTLAIPYRLTGTGVLDADFRLTASAGISLSGGNLTFADTYSSGTLTVAPIGEVANKTAVLNLTPYTGCGCCGGGGAGYSISGPNSATVTIADAPLSGSSTGISAYRNVLFSGQIATFSDPDQGETLNNYSAQIAWGDGNVSNGTIAQVQANPNLYKVTASHEYSTSGSFSGTVRIYDGSLPPIILAIGAIVSVLPAPIITGGWGDSMVSGSAPTYIIGKNEDRLPIGAVPTFTVQAPQGFTIKPGSIAWSGLTTVTNYLGAAADSVPTRSQKEPDSPTPTNLASYTFIVQAAVPGTTGDPYDVSVTCKYVEDDSSTAVTSYVTFRSDPPAIASLQVEHISTLIHNYVDPITGDAVVELAVQQNPNTPAGSGIRIEANTKTDAFPGRFMFLQLLDPEHLDYYRARAQQVTIYLTNAPNPGIYRFNHDGEKLGYEIEPLAPNGPSDHDWEIPTASTASPLRFMNDSPKDNAPPANFDRMSAGHPTLKPKEYTTFLMYKPESTAPLIAGPTVWVAIARVEWSWGEAVSIALNGSSTVLHTDTPKARVAPAIGNWPAWTGRAASRSNQQTPDTGPSPWP